MGGFLITASQDVNHVCHGRIPYDVKYTKKEGDNMALIAGVIGIVVIAVVVVIAAVVAVTAGVKDSLKDE